jgi:SAM-dependent methyltransferase
MSARDWKRVGEIDPYWGVLSGEKWRTAGMTPELRDEFFAGGAAHIEAALSGVRALRPDFRPKVGLDFGCGVGRLTIPLARACDRVHAVDISDSMIAEARKNCTDAGVADRVAFGKEIPTGLDFAFSLGVFQHIAQRDGLRIVRTILHSLNPGGAAVLHFHFWREASALRKVLNRSRQLRPLHWAANIVQGKAWNFPLIRAEFYELSAVYREINFAAAKMVYAELLEAGGIHSVKLHILKS